ncbi:MAG: ribosome silencing factor [Bacteroidetes bacterium]|nr:ribosome silencing factor [Bacteroidota bacterium]
MTSKSLAKVIAQAALSKKAHDVTILDLRKLTTMTDYFVVCSVDSDTQARAVADAVKNETLDKGENTVRKEGYSEGRWVLLDYVDVVAHVFHKETREFYNLEKLWGDAKFEYVNDEPPAPAPKRAKAAAGAKKTVKKPAVRKKTTKE